MKKSSSDGRKVFALLTALLTASASLILACAFLSPSPEAASVQQTVAQSMEQPIEKSVRTRMQGLIEYLDSPAYAEQVSWDEHVVLAYKLAQRREPTPVEFFLLSAFRKEMGMRRSTVLSVALRGKARRLTWAQCESFLNRVNASDFQADAEVRETAQRLANIPRSEIMRMLREMLKTTEMEYPKRETQMEQPVAGVRYKTYFGYLHAHSGLSDGEGDPLEAYTYAHDEGELDFFALTDHGELLDTWPWEEEWEELVGAAEALYQPGEYVTLWGFEWSSPLHGHINVINTPDFTSAFSDMWITQLYDFLIDRPEGFGRYNHPGDYDRLGQEFLHMELHPEVMPQMVGMETWNGNDSFDKFYYEGGWESDFSYWDEGNLQGWYLGALGAQDNHRRQWGTLNDFRTAVLAENLTREHIIDAYRNRRFYATEDKDLYLKFRCQGYPMGSHLSGVERRFRVKARDKSGDTFEEVRLYRNGELLKTKKVSGSRVRVRFKDLSRTGSDYYYVIVRQSDDNDGNGRNDEAISSPIWID